MTLRRVTLLSPYALSVPGGAQEQVLAMSRELARRQMDVQVIAADSSDHTHYDTPATVERFGRRLAIPANGSRAPVTLSLRAAVAAREAIARFSPDVVHLHEPFAPVLAYAQLRRHDRACVATFHRAGGGPAYDLTRPLLRRLAHGIDVAASVSASAAQTVRDNVGVITEELFNGLDTVRFREFDRIVTTAPTMLFVGRLEERKGVRTVVEAARLAATTHPEWRFQLAGDGPLREEIVLATRDLKNVELLGALSDVEKRRRLRSCDVALATSTSGESFGLVVLEPMAAETAVVVADNEGYVGAAGGHGELFSRGDASSLISAIERALHTSAPQLAAARAHAESWSIAALMDRYEKLYERARELRARS